MGLGLFGSIDLSATGLSGQRTRLAIVAENIANAETTRTPEGGPYRRQRVVFEAEPRLRRRVLRQPYRLEGEFARLLRTNQRHFDARGLEGAAELPAGTGVDVQTAPDATRFRVVYDPGHPDADPEGYVLLPNVNVVSEMVDMIAASRAYEANVTAIESAKNMFLQALEI